MLILMLPSNAIGTLKILKITILTLLRLSYPEHRLLGAYVVLSHSVHYVVHSLSVHYVVLSRNVHYVVTCVCPLTFCIQHTMYTYMMLIITSNAMD